MKEKIKNLKISLDLNKKEKIISLFIAVAIITFFYIDSTLSIGIAWILLIILLFLLVSAFMTIAGFFVIKSLLNVSAALVLMIFLGKSYCDISHRTEGGDNALGILLAVGILYIIFYFFQNLTSTLNDNYKKIKDEKWSKEKFIAILLTLFFVGFFIWAIYQVVMPIIFNLCIYK